MSGPNQTGELKTQPMCCGGAAAFYEQHGRSNFLEVSYGLAPPRIQAALAEELEYLRRHVRGVERALELGCGNGRVMEALRDAPLRWVGMDFQVSFLRQVRAKGSRGADSWLAAGLAWRLPFVDAAFQAVVCAQNTLGLLGEGKLPALLEAKRVTRPGGTLIFVVYSEPSLVPRLEWYTEMHRGGMMAPMDWARSTPELLVTEDGHASECFRRERLERLFRAAGLTPRIEPLGEIYWAVRAERR